LAPCLGAVEACYEGKEMRVCARGNFCGGMEVVAGAWVGRVFGVRDFWKKCGHRAHGGRMTYRKLLLTRWLYEYFTLHKGLPPC